MTEKISTARHGLLVFMGICAFFPRALMTNVKYKSRTTSGKLFSHLSLIAICFSSINSYAINCEIATSFSEKTICNDLFLLNLDVALNENYKYMSNSNIGVGARHDLKITQKKWISEVNRCETKVCILDLYKNRMGKMCDYFVITGIHPTCKEYDDILKASQPDRMEN